MGEFKREERYLVVKIKDAYEALDEHQRGMLSGIMRTIDNYREDNGKCPIQCVVIESDWPIYEQVWAQVRAMAEQETLLHTGAGR